MGNLRSRIAVEIFLQEDVMGKRILVLGVGAQGSTVAQRMDEEPKVDEIICADYDPRAVGELVKILKKGQAPR
jgi:saccharopine dehydrogenase-like NADP-dependent oxidoreductase